MNGGPKENANPTVLKVETNRRDPNLLEFQDHLQSNTAVLKALQDARTASHGNGISLLTSLGLELPQPIFHPTHFPLDLNRPVQQQQQPDVSSDSLVSHPTPDPVTVDEIFQIIGNIQDPEHPLTLQQLGVVSKEHITVHGRRIEVRFTPTIPHCSMATLIGLTITVKLLRSLCHYKITVKIQPGTHNSENSVNKQLQDKERVCAALENKHLLGVVNKCIANGRV